MASENLEPDIEVLKLQTARHHDHVVSLDPEYTRRLGGLATDVERTGYPFLAFSRFHLLHILYLQTEIIKIHDLTTPSNKMTDAYIECPSDMLQLGEILHRYSESTVARLA